jgi:hypothetical protein
MLVLQHWSTSMKIKKILKSTAAIVAPPPVRVLPTLLRNVATVTQTAPKTKAASL